MKIAAVLESLAKRHAQKPALIFREHAISFAGLQETSFKLAHSLLALGIKKGDKVAIYLPNCPEYVYSYFAIWCAGATAVPLDFMLTQDELSSCITHSEAKLLIAKLKPSIALADIKKVCPQLQEIILCERQETFLSFEGLLEKSKNARPEVEIQDSDYAIIFYTSGTTGKPKGVLINYRQLEAAPKAIDYFVHDIKENDTALCALPFSHAGGLIFIQVILGFGATVVLMERFSPSEFLKTIPHYKVNWFWLVPSMYYAFLQLKEFETFDLSFLRWIVLFGAPSSPDAIRRFHAHCPQAQLFHGWGLTETNAPNVVLPAGSQKLESVGRPAPWIEVKIVDEKDAELPQGQVGEIVVAGWVVTDGYFKDPELTAETLRNGWFHTGDLGRFDNEGYLYIAGRIKEMIKVAGEIVFEPEVEAVLHTHPEVAEVAVIGVPDKLRGEVPKAMVVLKEGRRASEEDLRFFCREHLAHFKIPHYFAFVASLPKTRTGKIDKERLRRPTQ